MLIPSQWPDCDRPNECRAISHGGTSTCVGWMRTVDRDGNVSNDKDPNIHTWSWSCKTCGKHWTTAS